MMPGRHLISGSLVFFAILVTTPPPVPSVQLQFYKPEKNKQNTLK